MLFLTGAAGKTGRSILRALAAREVSAKVLVRSAQQAESILALGDFEVILGDMRDPHSFEQELENITAIYYICPNMTPDELAIGKNLIAVANRNHISHFIYHSVLHPQIEAMPHHWQKMRMEETLFASGIDFTILQPCAYMQNVLAGWGKISNEGQYVVPYGVSARISMVDLDDVGKVAARVCTEPGHLNAIYELAGPEPLSQSEIARQLSESRGRTVEAVEQSRVEWRQNAQKNGMNDQQINVLIKMFEYYDKFGLVGNCSTLEHLLGQKPSTFKEFIARTLNSGDEL